MISIDSILISDDIVEKQFVCDLTQGKGGRCGDGDAGAPLTAEEVDEVKQAFEKVMHLMPKDGLKEVERNGLYRYDREFGWVTPTVDDKICAYGFRDAKGVIKCAFEEAYNQGLISWKKPISCHLYPIKRSKSRFSAHELLNYDPREGMCSPACSLGKSLKVPVYRFLKDALVRAYGTEFYDALDQVAQDYYSIPQKEGKK